MNGEPLSTSARRYGAALAVSALGHALVVLAIASRTLAVRAPEPPPIEVTIRDGGSGAAAAGGGEGVAAWTAGDAAGSAAPDAARSAAASEDVARVAEPAKADRSKQRDDLAHVARDVRRKRAERRRATAAPAEMHDPPAVTTSTSAGPVGADDASSDAAEDATPGTADQAPDDDRHPRGSGADVALGGAGGLGGAGSGADRRGVGGPGGRGAGHGSGSGDLRAWCASCPSPAYPPRARRQGWQGTVDVTLHVGSDGAVEHADVGRSSGFASLDAAAVAVARRSRFTVPRRAGLRGLLRYRFVLEEARARSF